MCNHGTRHGQECTPHHLLRFWSIQILTQKRLTVRTRFMTVVVLHTLGAHSSGHFV
jgi:hypothetical protein